MNSLKNQHCKRNSGVLWSQQLIVICQQLSSIKSNRCSLRNHLELHRLSQCQCQSHTEFSTAIVAIQQTAKMLLWLWCQFYESLHIFLKMATLVAIVDTWQSIQSINVSMCIPACDGLWNIAMNVDVKHLIIRSSASLFVQLVSDVTVTVMPITKYIGIKPLGRSCLLKNISRLELEKI